MTKEGATPTTVGIWRLVGATATDASGNRKDAPYGPRGMGLVTLTADGRMMAVLVDGRKNLSDGAKRDYSSYCGNYTFDGSTLTTIVDAASDPARMGSAQVRKVRFEGDRMILMPPPSEVNGVKVQRELTWERISPVSL
jgi:lipocalin-like protein